MQFHQYHVHEVRDAILFDDFDVLRQGGGDGGEPPYDLGPGPTIESIPSEPDPADHPVPSSEPSIDPADVPIPDDGTDFDPEGEACWMRWLEEIRNDETPLETVEHNVTDQFMGTAGDYDEKSLQLFPGDGARDQPCDVARAHEA